jgi:hypothetical protein
MYPSKLQKLYPSKLASEQWSLFRLWQLKKEEIEALSTITQFSIHRGEKSWMMIKKSLFCNCPLIAIFLIMQLSILVRYKTKRAVGAMCACLHIKCLMANYCMRWRGIFTGLSLDGGQADFSKKPPHLSL